MAATLKQTAAANARLNRVVHMSRSYDCRRKRDRSLCHRRLYCCVLWPVMAEAAPYSWDCPAKFDLCRRSHGTVEPLVRPTYSPDIRAWPCFVAHLAVCPPIGNADFGWAIARWSCGRDQVRADKEAKMATGTVKWFNAAKGYGFIKPQDGGRDVFVHISAVERAGLSSLNEGQVVEYEVVSNRGKESAENLKTH